MIAGERTARRRIIHIDMDAFFAAVEEKRNPVLAGKPVVIGGSGDPTKRGVVSTANYEARKYGIHSAMPLAAAYKLCPHAVFLPVDYPAYLDASNRFKSTLQSITGIIENVGIDEVYLDVSTLAYTTETIVVEIKSKILEKTGLTCSIGVGPKTEAHLKSIGIETIGQIAGLTLPQLVQHFGNSAGRYLYDSSRGIDESPLITSWETKSISRETTFQQDLNKWQAIAKNLAAVTRQVAGDLHDGGYQAKTVTIKIRFSDFQTVTRAKTIQQYTDSEEILRKAAFTCLQRIELSKKVRLIGMRASNLKKNDDPQSV